MATGEISNLGAKAGASLKMSKVASKSIKNVAKEDIDKADTIERSENTIDREGETRDDE